MWMRKFLIIAVAVMGFLSFAPKSEAAWVKGFDFRDTAGYVTDTGNNTYAIDAGFHNASGSYPITRNGVTFGWLDTGQFGADRNSGVDARFAGINYSNGGASSSFEVDLPAAGSYTINLAIGDDQFAQTANGVKIYDNTTLLRTIGPTSTAAGSFTDAFGKTWSEANWPANNVPVSLVFSSTKLIINLPNGDPGFNGVNAIAHLTVTQNPAGPWSFYRSFTATSSAVAIPASQTNFPTLISIASGTLGLETTSTNASGRVQNASGFDIAPFSDSGCTNQLNFEREKYVSSTGELAMWVAQPTLSTSTVDYLCYGSNSVTNDLSNSFLPWDTNYQFVYHMNDNAATTTVLDSTTWNNGNLASTTAQKATSTAEFGSSAMFFNGSTDYNQSPQLPIGNITDGKFTMEGWSYETSLGSFPMFFSHTDGQSFTEMWNGSGGDGKPRTSVLSTSAIASSSVTTRTWNHIVGTGDGSLIYIYVNGILNATNTENSFGGHTTGVYCNGLRGAQTTCSGGNNGWTGVMQELRASTIARSANYIATDYWNSFATSTFWTKGAETCASNCGGIPLNQGSLIQFLKGIVVFLNGLIKL